MSLSIEVAVSNLAVLSSFVVDEKPVYNKDTGEISKENRSYFVGLRRWWTTAFNPEVIDMTLRTTLPHLKVTEIKFCSDQYNKTIERSFLPALDGVKNIIETYKKEAKNDTAKKIREIYDKFHQEYKETATLSPLLSPFPMTPPLYHLLDQKKKSTNSTVAAVNAAAKERSRGVIAQYQQDLHAQMRAELKGKLLTQLKKVERQSPPKEEEAAPSIFNTSMINKLPQAPVLELERDDKEWTVDRPVLLRTQSERIERPVAPSRDYSRPQFIPQNKLPKFNMSELFTKINDRRVKMRESYGKK